MQGIRRQLLCTQVKHGKATLSESDGDVVLYNQEVAVRNILDVVILASKGMAKVHMALLWLVEGPGL